MTRKLTISDLDFVVPSGWEGAGDELHSNDLYAAETEYGRRILSGITSIHLASAPDAAAREWRYPSHLEWGFRRAVSANEDISINAVESGEGDAIDYSVVSEGGAEASSGRISWEGAAPNLSASEIARVTKGRTLFDADAQLFEWWIAQRFSHHDIARVPLDIAPWQVIVSLVSGLISRIGLVQSPHSSIVNRGFQMTFDQPIPTGATLSVELGHADERVSKSRPEWGIWTGAMNIITAPNRDQVGAASWTVMYMRSQNA